MLAGLRQAGFRPVAALRAEEREDPDQDSDRAEPVRRDLVTQESGPPLDVTVVDREQQADRKSTRLNSSHVKISYAVSRLKKKKTTGSIGPYEPYQPSAFYQSHQ